MISHQLQEQYYLMIKSIIILSECNINFHKRKAYSFEETICHYDNMNDGEDEYDWLQGRGLRI